MTGDENPSGTRSITHLRCVLVTSPVPVGSTHTPSPPPRTGEAVSPAPLQLHTSLPSAGSSPCTAPEAATSSWVCPSTSARTGVLWLKLVSGRLRSHFTAPVLRL